MFFWNMTRIDISGLSKAECREREHKAGMELCRNMLLRHFSIENPRFLTSEHGKPYLEGNGVYFNISHSQGVIACAVCDMPIGIDIEFLSSSENEDKLKRLAKRFFGENEIDFILASDNIHYDFYYIWTRKEAISKCVGLPFLQMRHYNSLECESVTSYEKDGYIISIAINI